MRQLNILVLRTISESKDRTEAVRRRTSGIRWTVASAFYLFAGVIYGLFWMLLIDRMVKLVRERH